MSVIVGSDFRSPTSLAIWAGAEELIMRRAAGQWGSRKNCHKQGDSLIDKTST